VYLLDDLVAELVGKHHTGSIGTEGFKQHRQLRTRGLIGVDIIEVVGLLAELHLGVAVAELLDQEAVVLLDKLPDQRTRNGSHFLSPKSPR
jgi:hypothetical protein